MWVVAILRYVHVLLMVFWIGADIGVFIAGMRFMDARRPLAERAAALELGGVIDRYPRVCFVAMWPVGLQLAYATGVMPQLSRPLLQLAWCTAAVWMAAVIAAMVLRGTPAALPWLLLQRVFRVAGFLIFTSLGITAWLGEVLPAWLSGKLLAYGAICLFALLLERAFAPVSGMFATIVAQGSRPPAEAALRTQMLWTYGWVLAIYAAVLLCGFLGTVKP